MGTSLTQDRRDDDAPTQAPFITMPEQGLRQRFPGSSVPLNPAIQDLVRQIPIPAGETERTPPDDPDAPDRFVIEPRSPQPQPLPTTVPAGLRPQPIPLAPIRRYDYSQFPITDSGYPDFSRLYPGIEQRHNLPRGLMRGLVQVESQGNPNAIGRPVRMPDGSYQQAGGIVQFMPATAQEYRVDRFYAPDALEGAGAYMEKLIRKYNGNVQAALQEYGGARGDPTFAYSRKVMDAMGNQNLVAPTPRSADRWGKIEDDWHTGGPPGMMPTQRDVPSLMGFAGLLLPIAALASGLPLGIALESYGAMARARQNGDMLDFKMRAAQWDRAMKEHQDVEALEGREVGNAFIEFDKDKDPTGLQQALMDIAGRFNDRHLMEMAKAQQFDAAYKINERRDMLNQPLAKWQHAQEQQKEINDAAAAMDEQWLADPANAGKDRSSPEFRIAHGQHIGEATREITGKEKPETEGQQQKGVEAGILNRAVEADVRKWVADERAKDPPHDPTPDEIDQKRDDFLNARKQAAHPTGGRGDPYTGNWTFTNADTGEQETQFGTLTADGIKMPGRDTPIPIDLTKPIQMVGKTAQAAPPSLSHVPDTWPGSPHQPPPGVDPGIWEIAKTEVLEGKRAGEGLSRQSNVLQRVIQAYPLAMKALGITNIPAQAIKFAGQQAAIKSIESGFGGGVLARNMVSLNTLADHIGLFKQYADALQTGDIQTITNLRQRLATETGAPEVIDFALAGRITGDEVVRLLTTTGGTLADREDIAKRLAPYNSPDQLRGAADTLTNYVRSRYGPLRQAYARGDPEREKYFNENMVTPEARALFTGPQRPIPGAPAQPLSETDQEALDWANAHPDDPRSADIKKRLGR